MRFVKPAREQTRFRPSLERLEDRLALDVYVWRPRLVDVSPHPTYGRAADWNAINPNGTGWWNISTGARSITPPGYGDDAVIDGTVPMHMPQNYAQVLRVMDFAASVRSLTITPDTTTQFGLVVEPEGRLWLSDPEGLQDSSLDMNPAAANQLVVNGRMDVLMAKTSWKGGHIAGNGTINVYQYGSFYLEGSGNRNFDPLMIIGLNPGDRSDSTGDLAAATGYSGTTTLRGTSRIDVYGGGYVSLLSPAGKILQADAGDAEQMITLYGGKLDRNLPAGGTFTLCPVVASNDANLWNYEIQHPSWIWVNGRLKIEGRTPAAGLGMTAGLVLGTDASNPNFVANLWVRDGSTLDLGSEAFRSFAGSINVTHSATPGAVSVATITCGVFAMTLGEVNLGMDGTKGPATLMLNASGGATFAPTGSQFSTNYVFLNFHNGGNGSSAGSKIHNAVGGITCTNIGGGVVSVGMYGTVNSNTYYYPLTSPAAVNFVGIVNIVGGFTAEWEVGSSGGMSFLKVWRL